MIQAVDVKPRAGYRIWLHYSDGAACEVDLSRFAGRGVFAAWEDRTFFESVEIRGGRVIAWSDEIDLCADALYLQLTGKPVQDLMPGACVISSPRRMAYSNWSCTTPSLTALRRMRPSSR